MLVGLPKSWLGVVGALGRPRMNRLPLSIEQVVMGSRLDKAEVAR